jgi:tryptophan 2,3-dioxygenase
VVHQVEELWMKLIAYTLLDIDEYFEQRHAFRILTLFERAASSRFYDSNYAHDETYAMTDRWGGSYGRVRDSISAQPHIDR